MQRARLDQREIGDKRAKFRTMLDTAQQVAEGGVVLVDHRGAIGRIAADQHVHRIMAHRRIANRHMADDLRRGAFAGRLLAGEKRFGVVDHIFLDRRQPFEDRRQVLVGLADLLDQMLDGQPRHLAVDIAQPVAMFAFPARNLAQRCLEFFLQLLQVVPGLVPLRGRQRLELLRAEHLTLAQRRQGEAERGAHQRDAALACLLLDRLERLFLAVLEFLSQGFAPIAVVFGLEGALDCRAQVLGQPLHVLGQRMRASRRKPQHLGPSRILEIIDVAPVVRDLLGPRLALEEFADQGVLAGARPARSEQVVPVTADTNAEFHRLYRAILTDQFFERIEVGRGPELQAGGVAGTEQCVDGKWLVVGHCVPRLPHRS